MPSIFDAINYILRRSDSNQPQEGTVYAIDGDRIDIRIRGSAVVMRNVQVIGETGLLAIGQTISLRWEQGMPVALATPSSSTMPMQVSVSADNMTIENSPLGLRVMAGGIQPWHLAFDPVMSGHTHMDSLERNGWRVDSDGVIYRNDFHINPEGQISMGASPNVIKLDATDADYRLWIGNVDPASANFSVSKAGDMSAKSGDIAGWDILSDRLSKNDTELKAAGELSLGTGDNVAVLSAVNPNNWRLWIGAADPDSAPFRVDKFGNATLESATISVDLQSSNYIPGQSGWYLDPNGSAEFQNVVIRGKATSFVFETSNVTAISGRQIVTEGTVFLADCADTDVSIDLVDSIFSDGDIVYIKVGNRFEWMEMTSDATPITGGFRYTVDRDLSGDGACDFYAGEGVFYTGSISSVEEGATQPPLFGEEEFGEAIFGGTGIAGLGGHLALEGSKMSGPYFSVVRRDGPVWNQTSDVVRFGRMRGFIGLNSDDYGFGVGDNQSNIYYTPAAGLRLNFGDGRIAIDKDGFTSDALGMFPEVPSYKAGAGLLYLDPDTLKVRIRTSDLGNEVDSLVQYDGSLPGVGWEHVRRYGFIDFTTSISFNQSDKVFTLSGSTWRYYREGRLCTVTGNKTVLIAPGTPYGLYFIYIDSDTGTLYSSTTPWTLSETDTKVPVATVLYNGDQTPKYWIADERHTALMDRKTHRYLHLANGTQHLSGGVLTGYTVQPSTPQDAHNTFQISETLIADEDLFHTLQTFVDNNGSEADHTFFYRNAGEWVWKMTNVPYSNAVNGYIHYDNSGTLAESSSGKYVNSYVLFTNFQGTARYTFVPGGQYSTLAGAEREDPMNFDWSQFPIQEVVVAYKFTWQTNSTYTSLGKCRLALEPKRIIKNLKITDLLETYAVDIKVDTSSLGNIVLTTDNTVQAVIERLNNHSHDPSLTSTPFEGRLSLSASAGWADITMSSIIYFHRYTGTRLALWNGSYFAPYTIPATAMQLSTSGMLAGRCYDIYAYPIDGTTFGLEYTSWTSYKARNVDIMYYLGNYYKATDATRLYIGTAGCTTTGQVNDYGARRNLWNYFNKENRAIYYGEAQDHTYTAGIWRLYNNQPEAYIHLVSGLGEMTSITVSIVANSTSGATHAGLSYPDANVTDGAQNYATVIPNYWEASSTNVMNNFGLTNLYLLELGNTGSTYYDLTAIGIFRS